MSQPSSIQLEQLLTSLRQFIDRLQREGFNIGIDSYCDVHNLLLTLAGEGQFPSDFSQLRPLIAPILCCSPQEQKSFNHYFSDWVQVLQPQLKTNPPIVSELSREEKTQKRTKKVYFVLAFLVVICAITFYPSELISPHLIKVFHPKTKKSNTPSIPKINKTTDVIEKTNLETSKNSNQPVKSKNLKGESVNKFVLKTNEKSKRFQYKINKHNILPSIQPESITLNKFVLWIIITILILKLIFDLLRYIQLQRFLKRHQASQPPDMETFFLSNQQQNLYSSVVFARTAQQLHKHRDIDAHFLDVATTVKNSIANNGFYSPVYQAIKALPEYLVLIDKAHLNDQLSLFVDALLQQLEDFGLFIEKYYFDGDPRRCHSPRNPDKLYRLESLQGLYANHRLIIFSEARHFVDPMNGKLYRWLGQLHEWQSPFLFTLESAKHWDYCKQQLHEAGFVVLAAGQKGLEELVKHISAEITAIEKQQQEEADGYPLLLMQSPRQFLERYAPDDETVNELLTQLADYLKPEGFNWLAACAVYPELHWQLTLYLGQVEEQKTLNEELLLRLICLPWLRFSYMPDWLRKALLSKLNKKEEQVIRQRLEALLLIRITEGSVNDFSLNVAKNSPLLIMMRDVLQVWRHNSDADSVMQDYVFQSFMAGRLTVKLPMAISSLLLKFNLLAKLQLLLISIITIVLINISDENLKIEETGVIKLIVTRYQCVNYDVKYNTTVFMNNLSHSPHTIIPYNPPFKCKFNK